MTTWNFWDAHRPRTFPGDIITTPRQGLCQVNVIHMVHHPTDSCARPCLEVTRLSTPEQGPFYLDWIYATWTHPIEKEEWEE